MGHSLSVLVRWICHYDGGSHILSMKGIRHDPREDLSGLVRRAQDELKFLYERSLSLQYFLFGYFRAEPLGSINLGE